MRCPQCSQALITLEFCGIEVDHCYTCGGIWLDNGEIEHLLALGGEDEYLQTMHAAHVKERRRRCPLCRRVMEKVALGSGDTVVLDHCAKHGVWSDAGELRKILADSAKTERRSHVVQLLDEMFAARNERGGS